MAAFEVFKDLRKHINSRDSIARIVLANIMVVVVIVGGGALVPFASATAADTSQTSRANLGRTARASDGSPWTNSGNRQTDPMIAPGIVGIVLVSRWKPTKGIRMLKP